MRAVIRRPGRHSLPEAFWPLLDQGVVSLGSFLTTIVLARALTPEPFGTFVLLYGAMLFVNTIHASLIVYPLSLRIAERDPAERPATTTDFLSLTLLLSVPLAATVFVLGWVLAGPGLGVLGAATLAAWQLQETARRALMADLRHRAALPGDMLSYLGQASGVALLASAGRVSPDRAFVVMAATSLLAAGAQFRITASGRPGWPAWRGLVRLSWQAGRLALVANGLGALMLQALPWTLALSQGRSAAAAFQALVNVLGPVNPVMFGLANAIVPAVARLRVTAGWEAAWERGLAAVRQGVLILLPYALLLLLAPGWVLAHLYAGSAYAGLETPLRLLVVGSLLLYLAHTGSAVLYGLGLASAALVVQFAGTGALLLCGLPLTAAWGLNGAALATVAIHGGRLLACARATHPARRYPAPFTGEGAG